MGIILTNGGDGHRGAVALESVRILSLDGAAGARVRSRRGRGWVTIEGDPADHWIGPGEEIEVRSPGRVVIETDRDGELQVALPARNSTIRAPRTAA